MPANIDIRDQLALRTQDAAEHVVIIESSPFRIGRGPDNDLTLLRADLSTAHAELSFEAGRWLVADRGSTNGTFVNGERITSPTPLQLGDLLHLAGNGFEILRGDRDKPTATLLGLEEDPQIKSAVELVRVLSGQLVYPHFQPILDLKTGATIGWEALARAITESGAGPAQLFESAERVSRARMLGETFAASHAECVACRHCWPESGQEYLFLNVHPAHVAGERFSAFIDQLQRSELSGSYRIVIELPESLVCETEQMSRWVERIRAAELLVAYDDFGAGQSRINDLLEVPPDFLKLDRALVANLHTDPARQTLVEAVVVACSTLGAETIAEGVETEDEARACREAGVRSAQGFYFARPQAAYALFDQSTETLPEACPFVRMKLV